MRKHEILAAIVEMRFVNCKLCDKAVYSKMKVPSRFGPVDKVARRSFLW